jgi:hypothetical protein
MDVVNVSVALLACDPPATAELEVSLRARGGVARRAGVARVERKEREVREIASARSLPHVSRLLTRRPGFPLHTPLQRARLVSAALSAAELVLLPLGSEYAACDAGLLPLSRWLLASCAVTELWGPTAAASVVSPQLAQRAT